MGVEETKQDLMLKRVNITIAIVGGLLAVAVGVYNVKKSYFEKPAPPPPPPVTSQQNSKLRSTLEDVGASWLETLKKKNQ